MSCMHCGGPLGDSGRAVERFVPGGSRSVEGRACEPCWSRRLPGSLLYRAKLCRREPCDCGWCAGWRELRRAKA